MLSERSRRTISLSAPLEDDPLGSGGGILPRRDSGPALSGSRRGDWNNPTRSRDGASSSDDNSDTGPENPDRDRKDTPLRPAADTSVHSHGDHVVVTPFRDSAHVDSYAHVPLFKGARINQYESISSNQSMRTVPLNSNPPIRI